MWDTEYKPVDHKLPFRMPRVNTHFNCRSTIIPITKSWEELGVEGMEEIDVGTRASMNGYVPKNMNFNDWLKTQSPETIEKTLGKGRAELFLQGKITMRDLITQQGRAVNLDELDGAVARNMASSTLKNMFKNVDFLKPGYRPPLEKPIILTILDEKTVNELKEVGFHTKQSFTVNTQKELLHGMRLKKINDGNALSKEQFLNMPLNLVPHNLYYGKDEYGNKTLNYFWKDNNDLLYAYFNENGELKTYGKSKEQVKKRYKAVKGSRTQS